MLTNQQLKRASFDIWIAEGRANNQTDIDRLKKILPLAMKECCTEKQRLYIVHFFTDHMLMKEIAALYGVNTSTVSRSIQRGLRRMYDHLKFCYPGLCTDKQTQGRLTQKKIGLRKSA